MIFDPHRDQQRSAFIGNRPVRAQGEGNRIVKQPGDQVQHPIDQGFLRQCHPGGVVDGQVVQRIRHQEAGDLRGGAVENIAGIFTEGQIAAALNCAVDPAFVRRCQSCAGIQHEEPVAAQLAHAEVERGAAGNLDGQTAPTVAHAAEGDGLGRIFIKHEPGVGGIGVPGSGVRHGIIALVHVPAGGAGAAALGPSGNRESASGDVDVAVMMHFEHGQRIAGALGFE